MTRFVRCAVFVCALSVPALAQAEEIQPMGWTADGNVVLYIADPLGGGQSFEWSKGGDGVAESFYAVCTPGSIDSANWNQGCTVCISDAGAPNASPADCGLTDKKWPKKLKAAKKSPDKKVAVSSKRTCTGKGDEKACTTAVTIGKVGSVTINDASPTQKVTVTAFFRKDSGAALLISDEMSTEDQSIHSRSLLVVDLAAGGAVAVGGNSAGFLKKWEKMTDKVCACKTNKCLEGLQTELQELAASAEKDMVNITAAEAEQLGKIVERMTSCATAIAQNESGN